MNRETSTDYRHPYRPRLVRVANRMLAGVVERQPFRLPRHPEPLVVAAQKRTGRLDLGEPSFHEPLGRLLRAIDDEARLHPVGTMVTRTRIISALSTRLRLEALRSRHPEIADQPLARPIVIVGLPRTGTTFLHRLLASDTARIRALTSWEALMPAPHNGHDDSARRIAAAERSEKALKYMAPDFFAVHPIDARGPEEEILLLDLAFRSTMHEATMHVPSYATWLETADQSPAYRMLARALQALSWQRAPAAASWRWVLKTPHHLEWLEEIPKVMPEPLFVWTHRAPNDVVGSFCSMIAHGRGVFSDHVDPHEIGRAWLRKGKRMVERAMQARESMGPERFLDVRYGDVIRDPIAVVRKVEERAGLGWTADAEACVRASLRRETKDRHGKHRYRLEDFGLSPGEVDAAFAPYRARYGELF